MRLVDFYLVMFKLGPKTGPSFFWGLTGYIYVYIFIYKVGIPRASGREAGIENIIRLFIFYKLNNINLLFENKRNKNSEKIYLLNPSNV